MYENEHHVHQIALTSSCRPAHISSALVDLKDDIEAALESRKVTL